VAASSLFWTKTRDELFSTLHTGEEGLSSNDASQRLKQYGINSLNAQKEQSNFALLLRQFTNPLTIILLAAVFLSFSLKQNTDASVILFIIVISGFISYYNERKSSVAIRKLLEIIHTKTTVIRDNAALNIASENIVPGDIVLLKAGDVIPADCYLLQAKSLFINEASLTGESYPAEKILSVLAETTPMAKRTNSLFMGTYVVSGSGKVLVINTGETTVFGKLSGSIKKHASFTDFEIGVRKFGYLLLQITLILVIIIFAVNVYFSRPVLEAFLFSLAIAVGLTPQLLPAIISINLSHGAADMCRKKVIVRRLTSIENFGSMDILCSDKTGTVTEGNITIGQASDAAGNSSKKTLLYAYINACFGSGFINPVDEAIRNIKDIDLSLFSKLDEIPYDFSRKRLSVLIKEQTVNFIITKGAFDNIISICSSVEESGGAIIPFTDDQKETIKSKFNELCMSGFRVLGICYKETTGTNLEKEMEKDMVFLGFVSLTDPLKKDIDQTIKKLKSLGISLKIITGDNEVTAKNIGARLGLEETKILTGADLSKISNEALPFQAQQANIFAAVEPEQKERIIRALRKSGSVVGYLGDGINDAPALRAADVSISVDSAAEVAKSVADIVLLEKDLSVLIDGVKEGRKTFANTLKYIYMAGSANFGNMFSMAGASLFLPFLPLLPKQILLLNMLTDIPEITIASDNVDEQLIQQPLHWNIRHIRNFMIVFGIISSLFDYLTFFVLIRLLHAGTNEFRTGWFIESIISASLIVLVVRTRKPFFKSKPGKYLFAATILIAISCLFIPFSPLQSVFGFTSLPGKFYVSLLAIVAAYVLLAEIAKHFFYRNYTGVKPVA
jgi:P-type Mg2+ transporter